MTTRALSDAMLAEIGAAKLYPVLLFEGTFYVPPDLETLRFWTGIGNLAWDSKTWIGSGTLINFSPITETTDVNAVGFTVSMSGVPQDLLSLILAGVGQNLMGKVYFGAMRETQKYWLSDRTAYNYIEAPHHQRQVITQDIDIRAKIAPDTWALGASNYQAIVSKDDYETGSPTGDNIAYWLRVAPAGGLEFAWSENGTQEAVGTRVSAVIPGIVDGEPLWVRVTLDADNGAGGSDVTFYVSDNNSTWEIFDGPTTVTQRAIYPSTHRMLIGAMHAVATHRFGGKIYNVEVRNGIDGAIATSFDADKIDTATETCPMPNGDTWLVRNNSGTKWEIGVDREELIADPYLLTEGKLDNANITTDGQSLTISISYESRLVDLLRPRSRRYTHEDHKIDYPADRGFEYVAQLQDRSLIWGGPVPDDPAPASTPQIQIPVAPEQTLSEIRSSGIPTFGPGGNRVINDGVTWSWDAGNETWRQYDDQD